MILPDRIFFDASPWKEPPGSVRDPARSPSLQHGLSTYHAIASDSLLFAIVMGLPQRVNEPR